MSKLGRISFNLKGIASLLKESYLEVPKYQRPYAWRDEHVKELLADLSNAVRKEPEYFLGTVVLSATEKGVLEVVEFR